MGLSRVAPKLMPAPILYSWVERGKQGWSDLPMATAHGQQTLWSEAKSPNLSATCPDSTSKRSVFISIGHFTRWRKYSYKTDENLSMWPGNAESLTDFLWTEFESTLSSLTFPNIVLKSTRILWRCALEQEVTTPIIAFSSVPFKLPKKKPTVKSIRN